MSSPPPTFIWRHKRERLSKCSLQGLEQREDMKFFRYPDESLPPLFSHILLTLDAPPLTSADSNYGLLLLDGTWRYASRMQEQLPAHLLRRSIPCEFLTAYPRVQTGCTDPRRGLASLEALYAAYFIMGRPLEGLLDHYYWRERFLQLNARVLGVAFDQSEQ
jgi:pre-rRNA-processing protein TSR3